MAEQQTTGLIDLNPIEVEALTALLRENYLESSQKTVVTRPVDKFGMQTPEPGWDPSEMIPEGRRQSFRTRFSRTIDPSNPADYGQFGFAAGSLQVPDGASRASLSSRHAERNNGNATDDVEAAELLEDADQIRSIFGKDQAHVTPQMESALGRLAGHESVDNPVQTQEQTLPLHHRAAYPERHRRVKRFRRLAIAAGAVVAVAAGAVLGAITGNNNQPESDRATAPTELSTTAVSSTTTEVEPSTTQVTATTSTTMLPMAPTTVPSSEAVPPAPVVTAPETNLQPSVAEAPSSITVTFTVPAKCNLFNVIQQRLTDGVSDGVADKDPMLLKATDMVLEKIAEQSNIPKWKLNDVYPDQSFEIPNDLTYRYLAAAFKQKYLPIITGGK